MRVVGDRVCRIISGFAANLAVLLVATALAAFDTGPKDQGIGGTGAVYRGDDNGISGTGYVGTITGFGSVIVNGREIELSDATTVKIDGKLGSLADLKIGQVIAAHSVNSKSNPTARSIDVIHAVIGRLDEFDHASGTGVILGQLVDFNSRLDSETLAVGAWYAVSGLVSGNGVVIASRVEPAQTGPFLLHGNRDRIKSALTALKVHDRSIPKSKSLLLAGDLQAGKAHIKKLQPFSLMTILSKSSSVVVETYVPTADLSEGMITLPVFDQTFMIAAPKTVNRAVSHDRILVEAVKTTGQFWVEEIRQAPFDDSRSEHTKTLTPAMIDAISGTTPLGEDSPSKSSTGGSESDAETESGTPADGLEKPMETEDSSGNRSGERGSEGSGSGSSGSESGGGNSHGSGDD